MTGQPLPALIKGSGQKNLVQVSVDEDGDGAADAAVTATDGHPFWIDDRNEWLRADKLTAGMTLLRPDGARVTVVAVVAWGAVATVHNLTVDDLHTYFCAHRAHPGARAQLRWVEPDSRGLLPLRQRRGPPDGRS